MTPPPMITVFDWEGIVINKNVGDLKVDQWYTCIKLYFKETEFTPANKEEELQKDQVMKFRRKLEKRHIGLYGTYASAEDLQEKLHKQINHLLDEILPSQIADIFKIEMVYTNISDAPAGIAVSAASEWVKFEPVAVSSVIKLPVAILKPVPSPQRST